MGMTVWTLQRCLALIQFKNSQSTATCIASMVNPETNTVMLE